MARTTEQKIKLLVLYDSLCKFTDETHHLTTSQLVDMLNRKGIDVSRKAIPDDMKLLSCVLMKQGRAVVQILCIRSCLQRLRN